MVFLVSKRVQPLGCDLRRQPRRATIARPGQRYQRHRLDQLNQLSDRLVAADEAGELQREVVRAGVQGVEQWEGVGQVSRGELLEQLRLAKVA
jgi:hypothetical protein